MAAFVWGDAGAQLTPDQIAAQRKIAQAMMERGADYSPIKSGWQGAARVAEALMGGFESGRADAAEKANLAADKQMMASLLGGGTAAPTPTVAAAEPSAAPVASPMGATAIPAGKEGFVSSLMPMAQEASAKTGIDPRVIVAQAALESGWGKSAPGGNLFGIKSHGQPGGNVMATNEVVNGQPVRTTDSFRAYASPQDSVNGYVDFMNKNPRYAGLKSAQGLDAQVAALGQSGYATDPAYAAKIGAIARGLPEPAAPSAAPTQVTSAAPQPSGVQTVARAIPSGINPAVVQALSSPYASDGTKKIAGLLLAQQMKPQEFTYQTTPDGTILRMDPRGGAPQPVYQARGKAPETKEIENPDGSKSTLQWDSTAGTWKPMTTAGVTPPAPSTLPAVPAGVDPKVWREGQSKAALANNLPATFDDTAKLRHEVTQLPAYKNIAQAAPVYQSMRDAAGRNTKAADLNIVYGLGKIMDPGSVVREGEIAMANNAQGWQEKLNGMIAQINSEGGLTPAGRERLLAEAHSRITAYKAEYDRDATRYKGIAGRNRINHEDVVPDFGTFEPWTAPKATAAPIEIDGYKIKAR